MLSSGEKDKTMFLMRLKVRIDHPFRYGAPRQLSSWLQSADSNAAADG
jgi:hypothetical protein